MDIFVADFETLTKTEYEGRTRIWAYAVCNLNGFNIDKWGTDIWEFFRWCSNRQAEIYFHNLKFDGSFILWELLNDGFTYDEDLSNSKSFRTLITDTGIWYQIEVMWDRKTTRRNSKFTKFYCSLKKLPLKVSQLAKAFSLEEVKGSIDYDLYRDKHHQLTEEEKEYLFNDVIIVAKALKKQFDEGLDKMTVGSDALSSFKKIYGKYNFKNDFPVLNVDIDKYLRKSYKGGFTWLKPTCKNKRYKKGLTYDVNSLYPSVMESEYLPYGQPIYYKGEYIEDRYHPLYICKVDICFNLKVDHIPCIQIKNSFAFNSTEYLESSKGEIITMYLTSVDLQLIKKQYNITYLDFIDGYKFKAKKGIFNEYISYWKHIKETSKGGLRQLAKLMLNSLYGKFGTNPNCDSKHPYFSENIVKYAFVEKEDKDSVYVAMSSFITAYARSVTINTAQSVYKRFIYADTDSIHLKGDKIPCIDIHETKFGAWKLEGEFCDSKFIRAKTYAEKYFDKWDIKCAGMTEDIKEEFIKEIEEGKKTINYFKEGSIFKNKLMPKAVPGGVILEKVDFTIKKI